MRISAEMRALLGRIEPPTLEGLRAYLLERFAADPHLTVQQFAAEHGVDKVTVYRWLGKLELDVASGPRLIDLRAERQRRMLAEAEAAAEEVESWLPTGSEG